MKKSLLVDIIAVLFIFLFIYAATNKLLSYHKFRMELGISPLLTDYADIVTWTIPSIEIIIAVMLATSRWRMFGLYGSFSMMILFTAYIVAITQYSYFVPCSCGGILSKMGWNQHLIFNTVFVLMGATAILLYKKPQLPTGLSY